MQHLQSSEEVTNNENAAAISCPPLHTKGNNPTADALQELIEKLSSDISAEMSKKSKSISRGNEEAELQERSVMMLHVSLS